MNTVLAAAGKWRGILMHFGLDEKFLQNKHMPCPLCNAGKDRWRFDDRGGSGSYYCSQCGAGDGMGLLMSLKGWDFKEAARQVDSIIGNIEPAKIKQEEPQQNKIERLKRISRGLKPVGNDPVRSYLNSRRLRPTKNIRHHSNLFYYDDKNKTQGFHAMVCLFQTPEGKTSSYHVTYLTPEGKKAPVNSEKKFMPPIRNMSGGAIRLTDVYRHIAIAEGIETALAVIELYKIPCWAAANTTMLEKFIPPAGIEKVSIFGDNDLNYAGQKSAFTLANRLQQNYQAEVFLPGEPGKDFADIWQMERRS